MKIPDINNIGIKAIREEYIAQELEQEEVSFNPFDVYSQMHCELNNGETSKIDIETFNKIMLGEVESDDALALDVIQAARLDDDIENISQEELNELYEIYFDELEVQEDAVQQYINAQFEDIAQLYLGKNRHKNVQQKN